MALLTASDKVDGSASGLNWAKDWRVWDGPTARQNVWGCLAAALVEAAWGWQRQSLGVGAGAANASIGG